MKRRIKKRMQRYLDDPDNQQEFEMFKKRKAEDFPETESVQQSDLQSDIGSGELNN